MRHQGTVCNTIEALQYIHGKGCTAVATTAYSNKEHYRLIFFLLHFPCIQCLQEGLLVFFYIGSGNHAVNGIFGIGRSRKALIIIYSISTVAQVNDPFVIQGIDDKIQDKNNWYAP